MSISVPRERCYYYECSSGKFRLTLFLPPATLKNLIKDKKVKEQVLIDFPDGADLDCTEPDFNDFQKEYGYRHPFNADDLQNTFYAIFSSTQGWNSYRGTGLIHADELEAKIPDIQDVVKMYPLETEEKIDSPANFEDRYRNRLKVVAAKIRNEKDLRELIVQGIDRRRPIHKQKFKSIKMSSGKKPNEVFSLLQNKKQ